MKPTLDEQDISVYASDAQTIQEPFGSDYSQGVAVGKTIPAKWWNWLFKAATTRLHQAFGDLTNVFTELKNLILDAGLTPDATDNTQVRQAVVVKTGEQLPLYIAKEKQRFARQWDTFIRVDENGEEILVDEIRRIGNYLYGVARYNSDNLYPKAAYSTDNVHWTVVDDNTDNIYKLACYCNGYYIGISAYRQRASNNEYAYSLEVYAGTDITNMTRFYNYYDLDAYKYNGEFTYTIAGNKIIMCTIDYSVHIIDMTNLSGAQYTGVTFKNIDRDEYIDYDISVRGSDYSAVQMYSTLIDGKYILGCVSFDGATFTNLAPDTSEYQINTHVPRRLRNGNIAFIRTAGANTYSNYSSYVMDSLGNVTVSATNYLPIYTQAHLDDCVLSLGSVTDTVAFSYDGINFENLPFTFNTAQIVYKAHSDNYTRSWSSIIQTGNRYFIIPLSGASPNYTTLNMREIDNTLSASAADYYDTQFLIGSYLRAAGYNQLIGGGKTYDYVLRIGGDNNYSPRGLIIEQYSGIFIPVAEKYYSLFKDDTYSGYANWYTSYGVNKVTDYTLYLR